MSKFKTVVVSGALLAALGLSTAALMMAYLNRPPIVSAVIFDTKLDNVAGFKPDASQGDRVIKLSSAHKGGNASFDWTCGKASSGNNGARAEDHHGHWDNLSGAVAFNAKTNQLLAVEVKFATDSFRADNDTLALTVTQDQHWFDIQQFPEAIFSCAQVVARTPELEKEIAETKAQTVADWTHVLRGSFTLNGIEQKLAIPAKVSVIGETAKIEAQFPISRSAFKVESRKISLTSVGAAMFVVDDVVTLNARIVASPDISVLVSELGKQVQTQQSQILLMQEENKAALKDLQNSVLKLESQLADLKATSSAGAAVPTPVKIDVASLPKEFADEFVLPHNEWDTKDKKTGKVTHSVYQGRSASFKMILVPGDETVAPFYMGETEVSWDLFHDWSHWYDVSPAQGQQEKDGDLRPSNADSYGDTSHNGKQYDGYPALGMSRLAAEKFCELLSKKTGRKYRLPTEAEWDLAYKLGGGDPADKAGKLAAAWCKDNAPTDENEDSIPQNEKTFEPRAGKIKTKAPNKLGLYDMLGNVAEWVKTPGGIDASGKNTFVRGGDFKTPVAKLTGAIRDESKNYRGGDGWNASYPNNPPSRWWFKDHYQIGFRLVCEPINLPGKK